mgnify:CR=1 FL=1
MEYIVNQWTYSYQWRSKVIKYGMFSVSCWCIMHYLFGLGYDKQILILYGFGCAVWWNQLSMCCGFVLTLRKYGREFYDS